MYLARRYGTTWGVFRDDEEFPSIPVYDQQTAQDLARSLNCIADRRIKDEDQDGQSPSS